MSNKRVSRITSRLTSMLSVLLVAVLIAAPVSAAAQTDLVGPPGSGRFGYSVTVLPNGNFVVSDPSYDADSAIDVGAVYLYNGSTLALISTLTGSTSGDRFSYDGVLALSNGNFVVSSPHWDNGAAADAGAVTWCSGISGCSGPITPTNSLVGTQMGDQVGERSVLALSNGNYVVRSLYWDNGAATDAGAVTWCSGTGGCSGPVTPTNSLVGTRANDGVGSWSVLELSNGNYVVSSPSWHNEAATDAGAVTWCSGTSGCSGSVTATNSLVGTQTSDMVGAIFGLNGMQALSNGDYVVSSPYWDNEAVTDAGAVTWCNGTRGCSGPVTPANSLVGTQVGDQVGEGSVSSVTPANRVVDTQVGDQVSERSVLELSNGDYVVSSPFWDNGAAADAGAVTWCSGTSGCSGPVTTTNSLVGTQANDRVSDAWALSNGNYVVRSPSWDNETVTDAGAVTWCSGTSGCSGLVTTTNSLVGTQVGNQVGLNGVQALSNGNFVVSSPDWDNEAATDAGAVTWCSGMNGCSGPVTPANSLVGTQAGDQVGERSVRELSNGDYVVSSPYWANGAAAQAGAVTWCSGTSGCSGPVTTTNSLVGTQAGDGVGSSSVWVLSNGNYVVSSPSWHNGAVTGAGAVTWCSGTGGCSGPVTATNSLVGTQADDRVGIVLALSNGNYVVQSSHWVNGGAVYAGAVTWCSGTSGCSGPVTPTNSLMGNGVGGRGVWVLSNGNYVVSSSSSDNEAVTYAGAVTWCSGTSACGGPVTTANSLVGSQAYDQIGYNVWEISNGTYVVDSPFWDNQAVMDAGAMTWGDGAGGTTTGPLTNQNSVLGESADGGKGMNFAYDDSYGYLIVGRPADNKVTVVFLTFKIYLPLVKK